MTFFASSANSIMETAVQGGRVVPKTDSTRRSFLITSEGLDTIDPAQYDHVVLYGIGVSFGRTVKILRSVKEGVFSESFVAEAVFKNNISSNHIYSLFQSISGPKVWIFPRPNTACENLDQPTDMATLTRDSATEYSRLSKVCAKLGFGYVQQPVDTLVSLDRTRSKFNIEGYALGPDPKAAYKQISFDKTRNHMNMEYGAHALDTLFSSLAH